MAGAADGDEVARARSLLARATELDRGGDPLAAWDLCQEAAELARAGQSPALLADAATTLRQTDDLRLMPQVHALCVEAMAGLPVEDLRRRTQVESLLRATASPWARAALERPAGDPETRFAELQAAHTAALAPERVHERLTLGDEAVALGRRFGSLEHTVWGLARRLDAMAQLGDRAGTDADLSLLAEVVRRVGQPSWTSYLLRVRAELAFWDGQLSTARSLADQSLLASPQDPRTRWLHLVQTEALARWNGQGLMDAEKAVRTAVRDAPYFARGWMALTLVALDRTDEARTIWAGLAPRVDSVPVGAPESLITRVGHAQLCVALADGASAEAAYEALVPWSHLYGCGGADSPSSGPVDLVLGRLATLRGESELAAGHLGRALARAQGSLALPFVAAARLALAELAAAEGRRTELETEARSARVLAASMGLVFVERAAIELLGRQRLSRGLLTAREEEVIALVAADLTNRQIAERLMVSERTVENHVSHALAKAGLATRAGLAAWYVGLPKTVTVGPDSRSSAGSPRPRRT